jgi:D-cysteine desulfhydrase
MDLARFPRRRYTTYKTPIEYLCHFSEILGGPDIYVKRDDLLGLTAGGNKTRKLEFLMADALAKKADTIITCGAIQSNHCRLTLSAAVREGLKCRLVLEERIPGSRNSFNGNYFLDRLLGVEQITVVPQGADKLAEMRKIAEELAQVGRSSYIIPGGGSTEVGMLGYVACVQEIMEQTFDMGLAFDAIIVANGSGGTHAGLLTGFYSYNNQIPVVGIMVTPRPNPEEHVLQLVAETADYLGINNKIPSDKAICLVDYIGPGYSIPSPEMVEAVQLMARTEGILLDPVYTGKAMAGLIDLVRKEYFKKGQRILFIHTGGSPALYADPANLLD